MMIEDSKRWKALCNMIEDDNFAGIYLNMNNVFAEKTVDVGELETSDELTEAVDIFIQKGWIGVIEWEAERRGSKHFEKE